MAIAIAVIIGLVSFIAYCACNRAGSADATMGKEDYLHMMPDDEAAEVRRCEEADDERA